MKQKELFNLLKNLNIPVAYDHFDTNKNVNPPFIVFREIASNTFKADDLTYYRPYNYELEVITEKKDIELQESIEGLLTENNIPYNLEDEVWDNDEKIYHNFYEI